MNRWTDGLCHFGSRFSVQKSNFRIKTLPKSLFHKILRLSLQRGKLGTTAILVSKECAFLAIALIFSQKGKKLSNLPRICQHECNNIAYNLVFHNNRTQKFIRGLKLDSKIYYQQQNIPQNLFFSRKSTLKMAYLLPQYI